MNRPNEDLVDALTWFTLVSLAVLPFSSSLMFDFIHSLWLQQLAVFGLKFQLCSALVSLVTACLITPFTWPGPHHYRGHHDPA